MAFRVTTFSIILNIQHNDIQHNEIQHNYIQHNDIQYNDTQNNNKKTMHIQHNDTQHNGSCAVMPSVAKSPLCECRCAECIGASFNHRLWQKYVNNELKSQK
jgi:hypothetical protein